MPTVPTIQTRQIQEQGLNIRRSNIRTSDETFGGGQSAENVSRAAQGLIQNAIAIEDKARREANDIAVYEADKQASDLETRLLYDRENGAMNKKGKDALGLPDSVLPEFDKNIEQIVEGLANDEQRDLFKRLVLSRRSGINKQISRHIAREGQKYDSAVTDSYIANERNAALENFHDEERINIAINRQRAAILDHADRNGLPAEWKKLKLGEIQSKTHSGVISRIIDGGDDIKAKNYYEKYKDQIDGNDRVKLTKLLEAGSLRGESQRRSDSIWSGSGEDLGKSLARAERIRDPKLRDETVRRIRQKESDKQSSIRAAENANFTKASEYIKNNPGIADVRDAMPVSQWESLTLQQQNALRKYNSNPSNNNKIWLDFLDKSPSQIANMSRSEFEQNYWINFDGAHRTRAEKIWKEAQSGGDKLNLTKTLTFNKRVQSTLNRSGFSLDKKDKGDAQVLARFEQEASERIEDFEVNELGGKRKATGQEIQKVLDDMLIRKVYVDGWFSDSEVPAVLINEDDKGDAFVPYNDVPVAERNAIENIIRSKGGRPTRDKVERAWAARLMGDSGMAMKIIEGN